jgi:biopolymer transport protein ExbD
MLQPHKSQQRIITIDSNAITFTILGIAFTLLVIVLVAIPTHHGHGPTIPKVTHPVAMRDLDRNDVLLVSIARDGMIYLGSDPVSETAIVENLRLRLAHGAERKLYVQADGRARYISVSKVLDAARFAGIYQIAFLVEQRKDILR